MADEKAKPETKESEAKAPIKAYSFPKEGVTINAKSRSEAEEKLEELKKSANKSKEAK